MCVCVCDFLILSFDLSSKQMGQGNKINHNHHLSALHCDFTHWCVSFCFESLGFGILVRNFMFFLNQK